MKHSLPYIFVMMLILACTPTVPDEYIQPDDMEDILFDYHVAQAMSNNPGIGNGDVRKQVYINAVLQKHGVSEADFDSSLVYYYSRADKLKDIYAHVSERLNIEAKNIGAAVGDINRYSQYSATGDTANIWNQQSDVLLIPRSTQNRFDFKVPVDSSFYLGDSFMFQFVSEYLYQSGAKDAVVCLVAKYEGDSIIQTVNHISISGTAQIRVPANKENKLKEMRGFIYLSDGGDPSETRKLMYISQMQLIRFHNKQLQNADGTAKKDSVQADSLQRVDNAERAMPDTLRRRIVGRRQGGTPLRPQTGTAPDRVDAGPVGIKKRQ